MIELPEITKAWMAGFFDGEGSIWIKQEMPRRQGVSPQYSLWVDVTNTVYLGVECFRTYFDGRIFLQAPTPKHRPCYHWRVGSKRAMRFLETLLPYFQVKQKQAELGILFQKKIRPQRGTAPMPQAYLAERERIRQAIQELNAGWPTPTIIDVTPKREQLSLNINYEALGLSYQRPEDRR